MMKYVYPLLFFVSVFLLTGCQFQKKESMEHVQEVLPENSTTSAFIQEEELTVVIQKEELNVLPEEYTSIRPKNLCPFIIEFYPEVLYVGDPLYVRVSFHNNTNLDAYAPAFVFGAEVHLKNSNGETVPWLDRIPLMGISFSPPITWQRVKPDERGPTHYMAVGFPSVRYGEMVSLSFHPPHAGQWRTIRGTGHLQVIINNGGVPDGVDCCAVPNVECCIVPVRQLRTLMVESSQQIVIKPRRQEEMAFFDWDRSFFERGPFNRQDMERIISELTPGTMRNLLKYDLLLTELMDIILSTPKQEDVETEIFESLEKTESFLNTLHEIERENLRRAFSLKHRLSFERQMRNNEKLLSKFSEMFGKSVPLRRPADFTGGMVGPPGARMWLVP